MFSIRGAITISENDREEILKSTELLIMEMLKSNTIKCDDVISIFFSTTEDINKCYPAEAARNIGFTIASLMCFNEMKVENSLKLCIRVLMLVNSDKTQNQVKHIYLREARILRKDLLK